MATLIGLLTDRKKQIRPKRVITLLIQVSNLDPTVVRNKSGVGRTEKRVQVNKWYIGLLGNETQSNTDLINWIPCCL